MYELRLPWRRSLKSNHLDLPALPERGSSRSSDLRGSGYHKGNQERGLFDMLGFFEKGEALEVSRALFSYGGR
jgi:hypothetical protein